MLTGSILAGSIYKAGIAFIQRKVAIEERRKAFAAQRAAVPDETGLLQAPPGANAQQLPARSGAAPTAAFAAASTAVPGGQSSPETPRRLLEAKEHSVCFSARIAVWVDSPRGPGVVGLQPMSGRRAQFVLLHYLGCSTCLP